MNLSTVVRNITTQQSTGSVALQNMAQTGQIVCSSNVMTELETAFDTTLNTGKLDSHTTAAVRAIRETGVVVAAEVLGFEGLDQRATESVFYLYPTPLHNRHPVQSQLFSLRPLYTLVHTVGLLCLRLETLIEGKVFRAQNSAYEEEENANNIFYYADPTTLLPTISDQSSRATLLHLLNQFSLRILNAMSSLQIVLVFDVHYRLKFMMKVGHSLHRSSRPLSTDLCSDVWATLPNDIQGEIFTILGWIVDDEVRLSLMLLSKAAYNWVSQAHFRIIFWDEPQYLDSDPQDAHHFLTMMTTKHPGYFQTRVEALWIITSHTSGNSFLRTHIASFRNLRHVASWYSGCESPKGYFHDGIRAILSLPLESLWLCNQSRSEFMEVIEIEDQKMITAKAPDALATFHAIRTVTHLYIEMWGGETIADQVRMQKFMSYFDSLLYIALEIVGGLDDSPGSAILDWMAHQENFRLVILLLPRENWQLPEFSFLDSIGEKVVKVDRECFENDLRLWKSSVPCLDDPRGLWAAGEGAWKKAQGPEP
ncbi:hypothetical protein DL96DRAFT_1818513 [Flagelloscypha sp. PMI_526]|nr:hypothetical protein DL96DRAFT_1818513 [Flagelloscypha sp. PMI_526]